MVNGETEGALSYVDQAKEARVAGATESGRRPVKGERACSDLDEVSSINRG